MSKKSLLKEFVNFKLFLAVLYTLVSAQMAVTMPSYEDGSPWSPNQFKNNVNAKINKPLGKISAVKIKQSSSATTFRPKQTMPRFVHREPQWIPGNDQMQIESAPNGRYGVFGDLGYQFKRYNKGFDLTTLVAVSLVSALLGALTFSVVDGGAGGRSIGNSLSLLNLIDAESVAKILSSLGDWASDKVKDEVGKNGETTVDDNNNSNNNNISSTKPTLIRTSRSASGTEMSSKTSEGIIRWYHAYRKDPNQLRCIQKLICETLDSSACAARSINSEIGGTVMNLVKYFVGSAGSVSDLITETVGNPSKCSKLTQYDFCSENDLSLDVKPSPEIAATPFPAPAFNLSSITPRLRKI